VSIKNFFLKQLASLKTVFNFSSRIVGIDLGTSNTVMCLQNAGIVLNECSAVSFNSENNSEQVYLCGNDAKNLIGKTPFKIDVISPIQNGSVSYYNITEKMLKEFLSRIIKENVFFRPSIICNIACNSTDAEKKILQEILERCNSKSVYLVYSSIVAAIGCDMEINKPIGNLIINIGGGITEISVISLGCIIQNKTIKYGGKQVDNSIAKYIEKKYHLLIGEATAEEIKKNIGVVFLQDNEEPKKYIVHGRDILTNTPKEVLITQEDIVIAMAEFTNLLIDNLNQILESTQPELMKDIIKNGITICGGMAKLKNIDYVINTITGLKVNIANESDLCVIKGIYKIISNYKEYSQLTFKQF